MKGWVFDHHPIPGAMAVWLWRPEGVVRLKMPFRPYLFVDSKHSGGLFTLLSRLMVPLKVKRVEQLFSYETGLFPLARVEVVAQKGWIREYQVLDSPLDTHHPLPSFKVMELYPSVPYNPNHTTRSLSLVAEFQGEGYILEDQVPEALTSLMKWRP